MWGFTTLPSQSARRPKLNCSKHVQKMGNTEKRAEKNVLCTSWKERWRLLCALMGRTRNVILSSRMHLSIHCTEGPAYIYSLYRLCVKRVDHLKSCFNQLQWYFICHFEPKSIDIIISIWSLSMSESSQNRVEVIEKMQNYAI